MYLNLLLFMLVTRSLIGAFARPLCPKKTKEQWYLSLHSRTCGQFNEIFREYDIPGETKPSCSLEDPTVRTKRFAKSTTHRPRWVFTDLKWKLEDPHDLFKQTEDFDVVRNTVRHALWMWSRASHRSLQFTDLTHTNQTADLNIYFARWDHGDYEPFDGRGGIVAHSGYPMHGRVHFDASELWTIKGAKGVDLRYVTLHELGHALGLTHSSKPTAIMHPIYKRSDGNVYLSEEDINNIRNLYDSPNPRNNEKEVIDDDKLNGFLVKHKKVNVYG